MAAALRVPGRPPSSGIFWLASPWVWKGPPVRMLGEGVFLPRRRAGKGRAAPAARLPLFHASTVAKTAPEKRPGWGKASLFSLLNWFPAEERDHWTVCPQGVVDLGDVGEWGLPVVEATVSAQKHPYIEDDAVLRSHCPCCPGGRRCLRSWRARWEQRRGRAVSQGGAVPRALAARRPACPRRPS